MEPGAHTNPILTSESSPMTRFQQLTILIQSLLQCTLSHTGDEFSFSFYKIVMNAVLTYIQ